MPLLIAMEATPITAVPINAPLIAPAKDLPSSLKAAPAVFILDLLESSSCPVVLNATMDSSIALRPFLLVLVLLSVDSACLLLSFTPVFNFSFRLSCFLLAISIIEALEKSIFLESAAFLLVLVGVGEESSIGFVPLFA